MADLSRENEEIVTRLMSQVRHNQKRYTLLDRAYEGEKRLDQIGIAVPPELRIFKAAVNVPRMAVDEVVRRQKLRGFQRTGTDGVDPGLREAWEHNNLNSQSLLCHLDARLYGRSFVSVTSNEEDPEHPIITVESPEGFAVDVSPRRVTRAALRVYRDDLDKRQYATLYLPDATYWLVREGSGWNYTEDPYEHNIGRVPLVMFLNRQRTGRWQGVSEMADVLEKTDAIARLISNMQVGGEALAWPKRWAAGVKRDDFVDKEGKPIPAWEAYMTAIMMTSNKDARFGSFDAAQLSNFHDAVNALLAWCAAELGLPLRFMGQEAVNPASEGAIRADEARLVKNVELKNSFDGDSWSWVMGLYERIKTGEWGAANGIRALWFDPSTPTQSQVADSAVKLKTVGVLSREGVWDEMGWDEARKDRERGYFDAELNDPALQLAKDLMGASGGAAANA